MKQFFIAAGLILSVALPNANLLSPQAAAAGWSDNNDRGSSRSNNDRNDHQDYRDDSRDDRQDYRDDSRDDRQDYRDDSRNNHHYEYRGGRKLVVVAPRHRSFRNVVVVRPHGHVYWGYGRYYSDNDAWKWMAFTAITLKVLDNLNEEAQRDHEAAQVAATTAPVGETINWDNGDAYGSVTTTKQGTSSGGLTCREFQQEITVGGKSEQAYGTACLQADGAWKIVES